MELLIQLAVAVGLAAAGVYLFRIAWKGQAKQPLAAFITGPILVVAGIGVLVGG